MANEIYIKRAHGLPYKDAQLKAQGLVAALASQYNFKYEWRGNSVSVKHGLSGVTGGLDVLGNGVIVYVHLNFIQRALRSIIESKVNEVLDRELPSI